MANLDKRGKITLSLFLAITYIIKSTIKSHCLIVLSMGKKNE